MFLCKSALSCFTGVSALLAEPFCSLLAQPDRSGRIALNCQVCGALLLGTRVPSHLSVFVNQRWGHDILSLRNKMQNGVILRTGRTAGRRGSWTISRVRSCAATTSRMASTYVRAPCCSTSSTLRRFAPIIRGFAEDSFLH